MSLVQMGADFDGNPPPAAIKDRLDTLIEQYGVEPTSNAYSCAGQALVAQRQHAQSELGCEACTEMALLEWVIANTADFRGYSWYDYITIAARLAVNDLAPAQPGASATP